MRRSADFPVLTLARGEAPLYRQIYEHFRSAITGGQLRSGDRLPSARALGEQLRVARGTIDTAYAMLAGEGYVIAHRPAGTRVSADLPVTLTAGGQSIRRSRKSGASWRIEEPKPFHLGLPALDAFPRKLWSRLMARESRRLCTADMNYPNPAGYGPLREVIAAYLAVARGILCDPGQVLITARYQGALDRVSRVLLRPGDRIWFEDPGYPRARCALEASGGSLVPVRVDAEGLCVHQGIECAANARLAVVTPSHQSPTGVALSLPRRLGLLSWAAGARAFVLEDDYDGEFHYVGRPLPALKSLDRGERVLYAGTFSKTLFPGLRLGYLVVPESAVDAFIGHPDGGDAGSVFAQRVVASFIAEGYFARHLKRMRGLYRTRRQRLIEALTGTFGEAIDVERNSGGMSLIVRLRGAARDFELARAARAAGFAVEALSSRTIRHPCADALLLGFTNIPEAHVERLCRRLHQALRPYLGRAHPA